MSIARAATYALPPAAVAVIVLKAEKARETAAIHAAACRYRRQDLVCSTCTELDARAARLAGEVAA